MQRILFLLIIQVLLNGCLGSTYDTHDSFKMYIEAISLNNHNPTHYVINDFTPEIKKRKNKHNFVYTYHREVLTYFKNELEKQNYTVYIADKGNSFRFPIDKTLVAPIYYGMQKTETETEDFVKLIQIRAGKLNNEFLLLPSWSVMLVVLDNSDNFQYYIPSMIKCAGDYFNKNFKGIVTCKR